MAVTINQTGEQFVNQINTDVAAAAQNGGGSGGGGSVSSVTHVHHLQMQGGQIDSDGFIKGGIPRNDANYKRYIHSVMMMNIENCEISSVTIPEGMTLRVFCYDANMRYTGYVTAVGNISSTTCYVKFQLNSSNNITSLPMLTVTINGIATLHKNTTDEQLATPKTYAGMLVTYETFMPKPNDVAISDTGWQSYIGNSQTRYFDNGYIVLPPNYSPDGEPVPLIVWVHGTGAGDFTTIENDYPAEREYVAKSGYAMCACSGMTNVGTYSAGEDTLACPSFAVAVVNFVKFCLANYNLKQDGVYLACKSAGGFVAHLLAMKQPFKVRALGSHSPALSPIVSMSNHAVQKNETASIEAEQVGVNYTFTGVFDTAAKDAMLNNISKWRTIDPFFCGVDLTDSEVREIVSACYDKNTLNIAAGSTTDGTITVTNETRLADKVRHVSCPVKIWHGNGDGNVPYANSKLYVEMARRSGFPAFLRMVDGAHNANHTVMKGTYVTRYGGSVADVPAMWVELIDWFNEW